tara:strand:- start:110 stop:553 length:444 start_codon:yes stop_codon:yes gene_type:complete
MQGALGLRLLGLGPRYLPRKGLIQLQDLLNKNAFWARRRSQSDLKTMLSNSQVIVSLWRQHQMIGFGRALSDEIYRAVIWDVVIDQKYQYLGLGKKIIDSILENKKISKVKKIYLMTTNCKNFYLKMGFYPEKNQSLMTINKEQNLI